MPEKLKPCPFCGCDLKKFPPEMIIMRSTSDAYVEWEIAHGLILGDSNQLLVMCERCGAKGQGGVTKEEAVKNWNRRAQQPNEPLTCDGCCENEPDEPWREICSECKRRPRQDLYAHKPEGSEKG